MSKRKRYTRLEYGKGKDIALRCYRRAVLWYNVLLRHKQSPRILTRLADILRRWGCLVLNVNSLYENSNEMANSLFQRAAELMEMAMMSPGGEVILSLSLILVC